MNLSCTLDGEAVTIVDITINGRDLYISYIDASTNLKVIVKKIDRDGTGIIATSATIT